MGQGAQARLGPLGPLRTGAPGLCRRHRRQLPPWRRLSSRRTLRLGGAVASGDKSEKGDQRKYTQFDPLLPNIHNHLGVMDIFPLSNIVQAHGGIAVNPESELRVEATYRYARLLEGGGEWLNAYLTPVGRRNAPSASSPSASPTEGSLALGHEVDVTVTYCPWAPLALEAGLWHLRRRERRPGRAGGVRAGSGPDRRHIYAGALGPHRVFASDPARSVTFRFTLASAAESPRRRGRTSPPGRCKCRFPPSTPGRAACVRQCEDPGLDPCPRG